ncbi:MAG TPA: hypothetical protein V6C85_06515 [Allocoleopsis sp.]
MSKTSSRIVAQKPQIKQSQRRSPRGERLTLWKSPQPELAEAERLHTATKGGET